MATHQKPYYIPSQETLQYILVFHLQLNILSRYDYCCVVNRLTQMVTELIVYNIYCRWAFLHFKTTILINSITNLRCQQLFSRYTSVLLIIQSTVSGTKYIYLLDWLGLNTLMYSLIIRLFLWLLSYSCNQNFHSHILTHYKIQVVSIECNKLIPVLIQ